MGVRVSKVSEPVGQAECSRTQADAQRIGKPFSEKENARLTAMPNIGAHVEKFMRCDRLEGANVMGDQFELQPIRLEEPHVYAVRCSGRGVGRLRWRQLAHDRGRTGWYLTCVDAPGGEQRVFVDVALEQLAADRQRGAAEWSDDADSAAVLSAPLALARVRALLQAPSAAPGAAGLVRATP